MKEGKAMIEIKDLNIPYVDKNKYEYFKRV